MIKQETVFVIGAGASKPYGYPTGDQLHDRICQKFPSELQEIIAKESGPEQRDLMDKARNLSNTFRNSHTKSIDLWLSNNHEYLDIGKLAIANSIIRAENQDMLFFDSRPQEKEQDWFTFLFHEMITNETGQCPLHYFILNKVYFITFNYDRSLEELIYSSLINSFCTVSESEIKKMLQSYPVFHVYGCIDDFPWRQRKYKYAARCDKHFVDYASERIKIINEEREIANLSQIKLILDNASRVFFLGFGYDSVNMQRLGLPESIKNVGAIYGTGYGLTVHEKSKIVSTFQRVCNVPTTSIEDCNCKTLLRNFL